MSSQEFNWPKDGWLTRRARILLRFSISTATGYIIYRKTDWVRLAASFKHADFFILLLALLVQGSSALIASARWRLILSGLGIRLRFKEATRLTFIGLFFNLTLLGSIGGDAARFSTGLRNAVGKEKLLAISLIQDRLIGLGSLLMLESAFMTANVGWIRENIALRCFYIAASVLALAFLAFPSLRFLKRIEHSRISDFLAHCYPKEAFVRCLSLSLANHLTVVCVFWLLCCALGSPISLIGIGLVSCTTGLVLSIPLSISGIGVREVTVGWMLGHLAAYSPAFSLALSECLLSIALFWAGVGALSIYLKPFSEVAAA
jgi:uncharacterized membrane protein YbhN (UPF0104 family)